MNKLFIAFEGCEGSGKSTIAKMIKEEMERRNIPFLLTREPGGTPISEKIRDIILDPSTPEMNPKTEALLYAASRTQHTLEKIVPALEEGKIVLCDRYIDSSLAYQGAARHLGPHSISEINDFGIEYLRPNIVFFFDIRPEESLLRIKNRGSLDRLEQEQLEFHTEIYNYFNWRCYVSPTWFRVDATKPVEEVFNTVLNKILELVER